MRPQNWVFLGDSLTEGIGSSRVSYVSELVRLLREDESRRDESARRAIHEFRLRRVDPDRFNRFIRVNTAGMWTSSTDELGGSLWLWNLACEGQTLESDLGWLPLIENLRPQRIFIHRGSLESILRPLAVRDGSWPWWVPTSWRGYAAMDPRCYFSTTWWRGGKQRVNDWLKQRLRLHLLTQGSRTPLMDAETIYGHLSSLLRGLADVADEIIVIGLLSVSSKTFPGSSQQFEIINAGLARLADAFGARFIDPKSFPGLQLHDPHLYYRDGFHPSADGARQVAACIEAFLKPGGGSTLSQTTMDTL